MSQPNDATARELSRLAHRAIDDVTLRRVRHRVLATAQAERWLELSGAPRWGLAIALALAVCACGVAFWLARGGQQPEAPSQLESSIAFVEGDSAQWQTAVAEGVERVDLSDGTLRLRVRRKAGTKRVIVRTPDGEVEDVGTTFHIAVRDGRTTEIGVDEGSVAVRVRGLTVFTLTAGETWQRHYDTTPVEMAPARPPLPRPHHTQRANAASRASLDQPDTSDASDAEREDAAYRDILQALRSDQRAHARALAEAYLRNFPQGFRRTEVEHVARD